ncbi:MAG: phosphodiesterase [Firmicutes bacterium]|nr:phosphodiesterase [Bacillota bacterium]
MKYLIASDVHGSLDAAETLLTRFEEEKADRLILLGDLYYHGPRNPFPSGYEPAAVACLLNEVKEKLIVIKGNCDSEVDQMISDFKFLPSFAVWVGGVRALFTHGHKYNLGSPPPREFDILFYGHEHTGYIKRSGGRLFVNPGSVSLPKGGTAASYAVWEGESVVLKDLSSGRVLDCVDL